MNDLNMVTLTGRTTKDIELKAMPNGKYVCSFNIATARYSNKQKTTDFFDCVAYDKTAEALSKYCPKGTRIVLYGDLQTRTWNDNNNNKRKAFEIIVRDWTFCESKKAQQIEQTDINIPKTGINSDIEEITTEEENDLPF